MEWLHRFTEVMDCISGYPITGIGISELARKTNLSKSTVHRMLSSMISHQLVTQNSQTKQYVLGPKAMFWGSQFLRSQDMMGLMGQYCEEISEKTGLYSYLSRFQGDQVYCTHTHQPSDLRNKYFVHVGQRMPFYCTAASKAILAYQNQELISSYLQKETFAAITPYTLTSREALEKELNQVKQEGVAFCLQELEIGVSAVSVPIFHENQNTSLSLSVVGERIVVESELDDIVRLLKDVSIKASDHLKSMHMLTSIKL
ncbi:IclR family transcriptional regulator [Mesobacillus stamsii]|uniref:DNA-binding IclR family transcriptional regulator n=1 Tax=Mesobacillus stamsii TaxID=225347 RepID=A0ABU0FQY9_9BACI|nr:IclR family transcriptional regulator [Mesobacillus stamsii]MDQ0412318.1 DNA-binding IclR family transcriptional regulator [Mesobacillus stamsii]